MRLLMTLGSGLKNDNWVSTSPTSCWCAKVLRAFMIRTMAASMAIPRSSSTRSRLWLSSSEAMGIRILRIWQLNWSLKANESVVFIGSLLFSFSPSPTGASPVVAMEIFFSTRNLPHESECSTRLRASSGMANDSSSDENGLGALLPALLALPVAVLSTLKASSTTACSVAICRS